MQRAREGRGRLTSDLRSWADLYQLITAQVNRLAEDLASDTATRGLLAWRKAMQAGRALDHNLVLLLMVEVPTMARSDRPMPTGVIGSLTRDVLDAFPVGTAPIDFGHASAERSVDPVSSIMGGEDLLARIYTAVRASGTLVAPTSPTPCS
jgi:hypothetical protein